MNKADYNYYIRQWQKAWGKKIPKNIKLDHSKASYMIKHTMKELDIKPTN
jgi:hypothetical protein